MKKLGIAILSVLAGISAVTFAQSSFDLGYVDLNFCDNQNQLHMQSTAGTNTGFCMVFNNLSNTTGVIKVALVDGEMSVGAQPVKACKTSADGYFPKFAIFSGLATGNTIVLPPRTGVVQRANVSIPEGFIGMLNGCVTFVVDNGSGEISSGMFQIINRKANIVDIVVSGSYVNRFGPMDMKHFSGEDRKLDTTKPILSATTPILLMQSEGNNMLVVGLENTGFINENYVISGVIYNEYFGQRLYEKSFIIGSGVLYGQDNVVIQHILDELPFYKGKYYIDISLSNTPESLSGTIAGVKTTTNTQLLSFVVYPETYLFVSIIAAILFICAIVVIVVVVKRKQTPDSTNKQTSKSF